MNMAYFTVKISRGLHMNLTQRSPQITWAALPVDFVTGKMWYRCIALKVPLWS